MAAQILSRHPIVVLYCITGRQSRSPYQKALPYLPVSERTALNRTTPRLAAPASSPLGRSALVPLPTVALRLPPHNFTAVLGHGQQQSSARPLSHSATTLPSQNVGARSAVPHDDDDVLAQRAPPGPRSPDACSQHTVQDSVGDRQPRS